MFLGLKKEHQRNLIFFALLFVSYGFAYGTHWDGPDSSGNRIYTGEPFPWVTERNGTIDWLGPNLINLGLNLVFYALISEIAVYRFERVQNLLKSSRN